MFNAIKILEKSITQMIKIQEVKKTKNLVLKIEKLLKLWRVRDLSITGKITIFGSLAISKIVHFALVKVIPTLTIFELDIIKKYFMWKKENAKIKQDSFC